MLVNNAGFNCVTPRVLVTWKHWPQREAFLNELECVLSTIPTRLAYYPGAAERHAAFVVAPRGRAGSSARPTTTGCRGRSSAGSTRVEHDDVALNVEAFCSLMAETSLDTATPDQFVDAAVEFCNDVVWGTLGATVLAHPVRAEGSARRRTGRRGDRDRCATGRSA